MAFRVHRLRPTQPYKGYEVYRRSLQGTIPRDVYDGSRAGLAFIGDAKDVPTVLTPDTLHEIRGACVLRKLGKKLERRINQTALDYRLYPLGKLHETQRVLMEFDLAAPKSDADFPDKWFGVGDLKRDRLIIHYAHKAGRAYFVASHPFELKSRSYLQADRNHDGLADLVYLDRVADDLHEVGTVISINETIGKHTIRDPDFRY